MTISNQTATVTYVGNGVQTIFAYTFKIPFQTDGVTPAVAVYLIEDDVATLIVPADYTITGVDTNAGGTVTYSVGGTTPLSSSQSIRIDRAVAYVQPYEFPNQGFYPQTVEQAMDWFVMQVQQLAAALGVTDTTAPQLEAWPVALTDETTEITVTGTYIKYIWPYDFTVDSVQGCLTTADDGDDFIMDIKVNGVSILSDPITIDEGEVSSLTSSTPPVVSAPNILSGDEVAFLISQVGSSATGAKVTVLGRQA